MENPKARHTEELVPLPLHELFLWGRVLRPHGLRGHLLLECFSDAPQRYDHTTVWVLYPERDIAYPRRVLFFSRYLQKPTQQGSHSTYWRILLEGVPDRTAAESLRRVELYLPRTLLPPLSSPEEFYYVEAQSARVIDEKGVYRGTLREIRFGKAHDFFIVENDAGEQFWIPAPFVCKMDRQTIPPTLLVKGPEGIWDPDLARGKVSRPTYRDAKNK
ncbi:MAG: ribosome maturation factor RimM [Bacteroidia bacterium]|nr:ribosome maturation factor RimM [Bacteroidia bacterium]MDW8134905.1 ribosome maturation factor RimM [Bacteroidia bacterium]